MPTNDDLLDFYLGRRRVSSTQQRRRGPPQRRAANDAMDGVMTLAKATLVLGFTAGLAGMLTSAAQNR